MRRSAVMLALLLVLLAGVCVRLGVWQLSRWQEKRARERARVAALALPPLTPADPARIDPTRVSGRIVELRGVWDTTCVVRLTGRTHADVPGIELARPLRVGDGRVMIERGWLPAADGVHPDAFDTCDTGAVTVRGIAGPMRRGAGGEAPEPARGEPGVYDARWLDADSLATVVRAPLASWSLRERPDPRAPRFPVRLEPAPIDARMHLSYAIQWFVFAFAALAAALVVTRRRSRPSMTSH